MNEMIFIRTEENTKQIVRQLDKIIRLLDLRNTMDKEKRIKSAIWHVLLCRAENCSHNDSTRPLCKLDQGLELDESGTCIHSNFWESRQAREVNP